MVLLRLDPPHGILWPLHQIVVLWGLTHACPGESIKVIVEPTEAQPYWSAATVTNSLVYLPSSGSSNRIIHRKQLPYHQRLCWHYYKLPLKSTNTLPSLKMVRVSALISVQQTWLLRRQRTNLTPAQAEEVKGILAQMSYVFSRDSTDLASTTEITHEARLVDDMTSQCESHTEECHQYN